MTTAKFVSNRSGQKIYCIVDYNNNLKGRLPVVLIVHGFKGFSTERHIGAISDSLVDAGFITLRPDLTKNPGRSYLPFSDMTYGQELLDLEDVFDYFAKLPQVDRAKIGITGHSLGGLLAAEMAAKHQSIKSLVMLSAVYDFGFVAKRIFKKPFSQVKKDFEEKGVSVVWSQSLNRDLKINKSFYEDVVFRTASKFAENITCPTLVISSGSDESVSYSHADRYLRTIGSKVKKMEVIPGADHIYSGQTLNKVCQLVTNWFLKTL